MVSYNQVKLAYKEELHMKISTFITKVKSTFILIALTAALGACATIEGAGEDIETAGEAVQDAAND